MVRPFEAISSTSSVACSAERFATSMCDVPAYRRVVPASRGQQAISRLSNPLAAVQSATSMSGVSGNGAVRRPSFIQVKPLTSRRSARRGRHRPSAPPGPIPRWRR